MTAADWTRWLRAYGGLVAALAIGALALFWNLTRNSLYLDEAFSIHIAAYPIAPMIQLIVYGDAHPPLFYLLSHFLILVVHVPAERYRLFTAPCGLVTIAATWAVGRRLFGDTGAAAAALLTALAPGLLDADRVYRMYAPLAMLTAVSWWCLLAAQDPGRRRPSLFWVGYAACAIALPYTQYLGGLTVASQCVYALFAVRQRWPILAAGALALAAFAPWIGAVAVQYAQGGHAVGPIFDAFLVPEQTVFTSAPLTWTREPIFAPIAESVVLVAIALGIWIGRRSALPFMLLALALQLALTIVLHKALMIPRYLDVYMPALALCIGALVSALSSTRYRVAGFAIAAALLTCFTICDADLILDPLYQRTDWYLVDRYIASHERQSDAMLFVQGYPVLVVGTYPAFAGHDSEAPASERMLPIARAWIAAHARDRIWYIENQYWFADPDRVIVRDLVARRRVLDRWAEPRADAADAVVITLFDAVSPSELKNNRDPGHGSL